MKTTWKSLVAGPALIILLTLGAYVPAMRGGFIWDDDLLITDNRMIRASDGLYRIWFTTEAQEDYHPLTGSLWWLEWRLWGNDSTGYHVVNVLLHAANAVLVWMILARLKVPGAWLAGCVFALHPVNVASVAWISEQKNTLSMFFYTVSILLYLRFYEEDREPRPERGRCWHGLSLAAFLLALLSKTAVVMLPVVLLGCVWWTKGRVRWKDVLYSAPFFFASLVLGLVTIWFHNNRVLQGYEIRTVSLAYRMAVVGRIPWFYLSKAVLPVHLMAAYPKWQMDASRWVSYVPGALLVACFLAFWWKRGTWGRPLLFGVGYFVVMLFPAFGFFDRGFFNAHQGQPLLFDHLQYFSIIGVIAVVVAGGQRICAPKGSQTQPVTMAVGVVVLTLLGAATWSRSLTYADSEALWRETLAKNPDSWVAHNNLGLALAKAGKGQEAMAHYEEAVRLGPNNAEAHNNLAWALLRVGNVQEAVAHFERAVQLRPGSAVAHYNLGNALRRAGSIPEAIEQYELALKIAPDYVEAHNNLGNALAQVGKVSEATAHYQQALRFRPDSPEVLNDFAWLLATRGPSEGGDPGRAVGLAQRACGLSANRAPGYLDTLAVAYAAAGRFDAAVATAQKAIDLARSAGQTELVKEIGTRLELYRGGRAYCQSTGVTSPGKP
ncbi:MAG: tetratricopeptide repeat protein [Verrucomicrobiia bacterium]|jgi:tetratricopeptide (TPR) repeat protein